MSTRSESGSRPPALNDTGLRQLVRYAVRNGYYTESFHSETERAYRNISDDDIQYGLERHDWILAKPPNYDEVHKTWEYEIRTVDLDDEELHLKIAAVPEDRRFEIISKW